VRFHLNASTAACNLLPPTTGTLRISILKLTDEDNPIDEGSKIHDIDGNEYIDHNLCFGALMAGHCHPAVVKAVETKLHEGTTFGMPHEQEWELAEEICARYPVEMVRFGSSGTEVTMHACRIARAATGRDKIIKFEGSYHGLHDTALVSVKPKETEYGD